MGRFGERADEALRLQSLTPQTKVADTSRILIRMRRS